MRLPLRNVQEYAAKFFFFILYAEDSFDWLRRCDYRFSIEKRALVRKFDLTREEVTKCFKCLSNLGWIYNYRADNFMHRFSVRPPNWLELSEMGKLTNRYVAVDAKYGDDTSKVTYNSIKDMEFLYQANKKRMAEQIKAIESSPESVDEVTGG